MTCLSVNLNKVALLRNQRDVGYPSPLEAARVVLAAGAAGITVHPRPDERHVRTRDVRELAELLRLESAGAAELNIEGNPKGAWLELVREVRPAQATLVPDDPGARTSEAGWEVAAHRARLAAVVGELRALGIRVSLFVEADPGAVRAAHEVGADRVELYTGPYARAFASAERDAVTARYARAGEEAHALGLGVNAGHDLNLENLGALQRALPFLDEVSIGHALTSDALWGGLDAAVRAYLDVLAGGAGRADWLPEDAYRHRRARSAQEAAPADASLA